MGVLTSSTVKFPFCLIYHHSMKTYDGVELLLHVYITTTLVGNDWSYSLSGCYGPHWKGGCVASSVEIGDVTKK
jgi:hypothetical protein